VNINANQNRINEGKPASETVRSSFYYCSGSKRENSTAVRSKRKAVAIEMKVGDEVVYIKHMRTKTGTSITQGVANVYRSVAQAKIVEPEYIQKRNSTPKPKEEATA
jgi:ribosomal protein S24E